MYLPESTAAAGRWVVDDYVHKVETTDPAGDDGVLVARFDQVPHDELWLLDRVVVSTTSSAETVAFLYLDAVDDSRCVDGSRAGNFDVADQGAPVLVAGGSELLCVWQGASAGAVGTVRAQFTIMRGA